MDHWGPYYWGTMHLTALHGPQEDLATLVELYTRIMPCPECKTHWTEYLQGHPVQGDSFNWTVDAHNDVNKRLGKPIMDYETAKNLWTLRSNYASLPSSHFPIWILILFVFLFLLVVYKRFRI